ncbi:D-3-phosphoglycerate dehydrogenase-like protein [Leptomonas pyrrhocoris]|uniref:D-3-phosphoglycerate dehydrogenase-like protein n=1 Tax=Leptomonas pyrrhocoris TaxID=157538 RepID=A0A0N0DQP1_LEPPY|nr:D-3-phosphoglycerate dehydrogenase-like protein [Leptomonas pyrrhocoris]XP_015652007.1 D-3-phosphoglycerate dehydrogenase-like protein [Leptomonas pyrrhocoris]KPA73567.1 D-3-phosphoglycerate dehydrogenase-like protein [Leptomonas pyrrhocoris]KPA73568.1 D-3-phosphoglycerate dehydrogenase-like protein [Leptomonas pyrrhocoris]|eukprot:XP_015652006.1 D-3-phosphoglycerate dehydrogenase-like protein [Leptomonas pyrrhocoris]
MKNIAVDPPYHALLLEGVNPAAKELLESKGCVVEALPSALDRDVLLEKIANVHFLGIRSKTKVTKEILDAAPKLLAIGCFCIGTNQVDLDYANKRGVAVFNSPFANTRSVAELVIGEIISLSRKMTQRSEEVHRGIWNKTHVGCYEVRGKTLGIVGYGHIGSQVGVLAEALGMNVIFYDVVPTLVIGNATKFSHINDLLTVSDFITIHVPETEITKGMLGEEEIRLMKQGSYLINASRGSVVDLEALARALRDGHLCGAAVDVFPEEPGSNKELHKTPLQGISNVILTPHIGGSTCEAQAAIGMEVGSALAQFVTSGTTVGAVNFPQLVPPPVDKSNFRITNVHLNVPGALKDINKIAVDLDCNIGMQFLSTYKAIGYLIMDVDKDVAAELRTRIASLDCSMRTLIIR